MFGDDEEIRSYKDLADDYRRGMERQDKLIATMQVELDAKDALCKAVIESLRDVEQHIAAGKGEWGSSGYVRDSVWDGWIGGQLALRHVLQRAGIDPDGEGRP